MTNEKKKKRIAISGPTLAKGFMLSRNNGVFAGRDFLDNQRNNFPESRKVLDSKQEHVRLSHRKLGLMVSQLYQLVYSMNVGSNSNHVNQRPAVFQRVCFRNGQVWLNIGLAISDKKNQLACARTATFAQFKYLISRKSFKNCPQRTIYIIDFFSTPSCDNLI